MVRQSSYEQRLEALEREVAEIRRRLTSLPPNGNWVDEISGSMKQHPEFDEVVRLGREFRASSASDAASE